MLETIWAKLMRDFTTSGFFLKHKGDNAVTDIRKSVALRLCIPFFEGSNFFFKIAHAIQERRLLLVGIEGFALRIYQGAGQIDDRRLYIRLTPEVVEAARNVQCGLNARYCG